MRKFIKKVLIFITLLLIIAITFPILFFTSQRGVQDYNYPGIVMIKYKRLMECKSPKIILVGDSNLVHGIDSKLMQEELKMPVVNLGYHKYLGNFFSEQLAKLNIQSGDIVVIAHADYADRDDLNPNRVTFLWITLNGYYELLPTIRECDRLTMIKSFPKYFKAQIHHKKEVENEVFYTKNFNEFGEIIDRPNYKNEIGSALFDSKDNDFFKKISEENIKRINEFITFVKNRNAHVVIAGTPIAFGEKAIFKKEDVKTFNDQLKKSFNCEIISDFTDYMYPYDYFYDFELHLNAIGTQKRTEQLIKDIKKWREQLK